MSLDTTGVFSDLANIQTDTLSVRYGELKPFVENRMIIDIDFTELDIINPIKLKITGNSTVLNVFQRCDMMPVTNIDIADIQIKATVNNVTKTANALSVSGNNITYIIEEEPQTGDTVSISILWATTSVTYGKSDIYTFVVG
ncbi:MAG: hypothetical protein LBC89_05805 [Bacteroidales bacterium]|nr:hypothetical protein [Bacteroidales bacterium]